MHTPSFWQTTQRPLIVLAPMAGVTDTAFRQIICRYGRPHAVFTEFVSCDGLCSPGRDRLLIDLKFHPDERPVVAQLFGRRPETFFETAGLVRELGFAAIDINCGCPDRNVVKQGAGAALIGNAGLVGELLQAAKEGAGHALPVSIKTRLGDDRDIVEEWVDQLLDFEPAAITIHARTRAEMSKVPARWEAIGRAKAVAVARGSQVPILGNGDVTSVEHARRLVAETGCDGAMLGRAIYGNPWLFSPTVSRDQITVRERLRVMVEHTHLFQQEFGDNKSFLLMKKHYKAYSSGFAEAKELRVQLMENAITADDVEAVVEAFFARHPHIADGLPDPHADPN